MLEQFLVTEIYVFFLVFCRMGSALMLVPGLGELYINPRIRLLLALMVSLIVAPIAAPGFPPMPQNPLALGMMAIGEIIIGLFLGSVSRLLISAMHVVGQIVALQSGLASATFFDPNISSQGTSLGNLLGLLAAVLVFMLNIHHLALRGMADSYSLFAVGQFPPVEDFANLISTIVSRTFAIGVQLAAPFLVVAFVLYLGAGILGRLMPTLQVFFIIVAPQILISFALLAVSLSGMMLWYMRYYEDTLGGFLIPVK